MLNKGGIKVIVFSEVFLIIFSVVSFAFLIGEASLVKGQSQVRGSMVNGEFTPNPNGNLIRSYDASGRFIWQQGARSLPQTSGSTIPTSSVGAFTSEVSTLSNLPQGFQFTGVPGISGGTLPASSISQIQTTAEGGLSLIGIDGSTLTTLTQSQDIVAFKAQITSNGGELVAGPTGAERGLFGIFTTTNPIWGHLLEGLGWSLMVVGAIQLIGGLAGLDKGLTDALSTAAFAGIMAGKLSIGIAEEVGSSISYIGGTGLATAPTLIGLALAIIVFVAMYSKEKQKLVQFECLPFEAPVGGKDCEKCNTDPFRPCSEYRCRALGQACKLVNPGTIEEKCVWVAREDVKSPTITPWTSVLTQGHKYANHNTRPPSLGTKIVRDGVSNGCLAAFTPLTFGITTNEPAQCKIDIVHTNKYDEMQYFFGGSNYYIYNHTHTMSLPSPDSINTELGAEAGPELQNDGRYELFVRCRDSNGNDDIDKGNENVDEYAIQFCVDPSPDTTPPVIVDTSIVSGSPVSFGVDEVPLLVYVNEPSECKWSVQNKDYANMENQMSCATRLIQVNSRELYTCSTNLTGVKDREENKYYFRCKDQPNKPDKDRNTNVGSYEFVLKGSQPLNIIETSPNETITGSTNAVNVELKVKTDDGAQEGKAICYFSNTGVVGSYVLMFDTNNFEHKQLLTLTSGSYEYFFRCVDLGGNSASASTRFNVFVDTQAPLVTRAYHYLDTLKINTNEDASCVYSLNSCNYVFDEGIDMIQNPPSIRNQHYAEWQPSFVYYVKCKDDFGNEPSPNACSIVAGATNV